MAGNVSLNTVTDGLVLYLDAANPKSLADVPSTNLLKYSQQIENWNKYQSSVSADTTTAPDGTNTADTNIETSGLTGNRGVQQQFTGMISGQTYTFSIYAKNFNGRNIQMTVYEYPGYINWYQSNFYLQSGTTLTWNGAGSGVRTNTSMVNVGDGWYRCSISGYITGATQLQPNINLINSGNTVSYTGDGVSGVYLWGGQLEVGPVATTYIPTTTTSASRVPTWVDISKGGNNGTLVNNLTYDYSNGGSLVFNGINNYVSLTYNPSLTNQITVDIWVKLQSTTPFGTAWIVGRESSYRMIYTNSIFTWVCGTVNNGWYTTGTVVSAPSTPTSGIYNVVGTYDGSNLRIYLNGVLITTGSAISGNILNNGTYYLFNSVAGSVDNGKGLIYNTKLYNRALSASEVLQNYNATKSKFEL